MKHIRLFSLVLFCGALLLLSPAVSGVAQTDDQLRTPAEASPERTAILDAVRDLYKEGDDHPTKFKVNYLKVHNGWAWINVTPLNEGGTPVGEPAPLLFHKENGKWSSKDLNEVAMDGEGHEGPHDPSAKYLAALQKKYPGVPTDILPGNSSASDPIQVIRQHYATINKSIAKYKQVKKKLSGYSAESGELTAYFDGAKIAKIMATHFGEGGKAVEEYYYWDDKLIFVFRKDSNYDKPMSGKVARTTESRFYFADDHLIRWIDENGKQMAKDGTEFAEKETENLQSSKEFAAGARSRKSTIEAAP